MTSATKVLLVVIGYGAAMAVAFAAVAVHVGETSGPERQSAGGMYAFGDSLTFLIAFMLAATPATAGALFMLRRRPRFWSALETTARLVAATAVPAPFLYYLGLGSWSGWAVLRLLVAPALGSFWFLCSLVAPSRSPRRVLLVASLIEAGAFACVAIRWFLKLGAR